MAVALAPSICDLLLWVRNILSGLSAPNTPDVAQRDATLQIKCRVMEIELNDADLGRRIGGGADSAAEAELFRRMAPRIRLYGLRHLRDEHAAEDLVQQVLIIALEALRAGRLRDPEKVASFVLGTCRMTVLDLRRNAQRKERLMEEFAPDLPAPVPLATPDLDRGHLTRCVQ
jgi:RNA polymerase sigma-70 factor (ECF subfamily)